MIPLEALKSKEGIAYLGGAVASFLLAALLLVGGVERYLEEDTLRDAVAAYHQDDNQARALLLEAKQKRPLDASPLVLLGAYELEHADDPERLAAAEKLFEDARGLDPTRPSATLGLAAVRLREAAAKAKEGRAQDAAAVLDLLNKAGLDPKQPDVAALVAAAEVLRGRAPQALDVLDKTAQDVVPSREGEAAWHWNRAVAAVLCRRASAMEAAFPAFLLRRLPMPIEGADPQAPPADPSKLLALAYRVSLADPGALPADEKDLSRRADLARKVLQRLSGGSTGLRGRLLPTGTDEGIVLNALGLAYFRAKRFDDAARAFDEATHAPGCQLEPLYVMNLAEARYRAALAMDDEKQAKEKNVALQQAAETYKRVAEMLTGKAGREATRTLAATNAAAIYLQAGKTNYAMMTYKQLSDTHPNAAQRARDLGALMDQDNRGVCVEEYKKAIALNHPDSQAMERRIRFRAQGGN
jgi:tetratricopeptide (TPR) repeat protein